MSKLSFVLAGVLALAGCSSSSSSSSSASPSGSSAASKSALPEMKEFKNDKLKLSFKAPADTKDGGGGEMFNWKTMVIIAEGTIGPVAKEADLLQMVPNKDGVKFEQANEGDLIISTWKENPGPSHVICGQKGKSGDLRLAFEPGDKDVGVAICKSLKIQ